MSYGEGWSLTDAKNLREDEIRKLFSAAKKFGPRAHLAIILAYNGAMRVSELIHLKVSDFNFGSGRVSILPLKKAGKRKVRDQFGKIRIVDKPLPKKVESPIPPVAMQAAEKYIEQEKLNPDSWLFPGRAASKSCRIVKLNCPGGHITKRTIQKTFDKICIAAGIKVPGRGIHSLKHGRLTEVAFKSKDPYLVKQVGRHSSVALSDHYVKYVEFQKQVNRIGGRV